MMDKYIIGKANWLDVAVSKLILISERVNKKNYRHLSIIHPDDYVRLKAKNGTIRCRTPRVFGMGWECVDEMAGDFYVFKRKRHDATIPIKRTKIPFKTEFRFARSGSVHLKHAPPLVGREARSIDWVMRDNAKQFK